MVQSDRISAADVGSWKGRPYFFGQKAEKVEGFTCFSELQVLRHLKNLL